MALNQDVMIVILGYLSNRDKCTARLANSEIRDLVDYCRWEINDPPTLFANLVNTGQLPSARWVMKKCRLTGDDVRADDNCLLKGAVEEKHVGVAKFLVDEAGLTGDDVRVVVKFVLREAAKTGCFDVTKFLARELRWKIPRCITCLW